MNKNSISGCTYFFFTGNLNTWLPENHPRTQIRMNYWTLPKLNLTLTPFHIVMSQLILVLSVRSCISDYIPLPVSSLMWGMCRKKAHLLILVGRALPILLLVWQPLCHTIRIGGYFGMTTTKISKEAFLQHTPYVICLRCSCFPILSVSAPSFNEIWSGNWC